MPGRAGLVAREEGVLAGLDVALAVFRRVDPSLAARALIEDGARIRRGDLVGEVEGHLAPILTAERTALNFLRRLSGVATETSAYVSEVEEYPATIVDTRKTTPGMRTLEKYAVRAGGGRNHRRNLGDGILIKDNHVEALRASGMSLGDVVRKARREKAHTINVEVEVEDLEQVEEVLDAGAEILLLDNMGPGGDGRRRPDGVRAGRHRSLGEHHPEERPGRGGNRRRPHIRGRPHPLLAGPRHQPGRGLARGWYTTVMNISLSPEVQRRIEKTLSKGRYRSANELMLDALDALEGVDETSSEQAQQFDAQIREALQEIERGEYTDYAREELTSVFKRARAQGLELMAKSHPHKVLDADVSTDTQGRT